MNTAWHRVRPNQFSLDCILTTCQPVPGLDLPTTLPGHALLTYRPLDLEPATLCSSIRYIHVALTSQKLPYKFSYHYNGSLQRSRKLYIFAGQRGKEYLTDFFTYEVDTNNVEHINFNDLGTKDSNHIPAPGFTQKATIDPELGEIYVLSVRMVKFWRLRIIDKGNGRCMYTLCSGFK